MPRHVKQRRYNYDNSFFILLGMSAAAIRFSRRAGIDCRDRRHRLVASGIDDHDALRSAVPHCLTHSLIHASHSGWLRPHPLSRSLTCFTVRFCVDLGERRESASLGLDGDLGDRTVVAFAASAMEVELLRINEDIEQQVQERTSDLAAANQELEVPCRGGVRVSGNRQIVRRCYRRHDLDRHHQSWNRGAERVYMDIVPREVLGAADFRALSPTD